MSKGARASFVALATMSVALASSPAHADKAACAAAAEAGQRLAKAHKLVEAREQLLLCSSRECPEIIAQDCTQWLGEVERNVSSVVLRPRDVKQQPVADVRVTESGKVVAEHTSDAPIELDPGPHVFRFEHAGYEPIEVHFDLGEGKRGQEIAAEMHGAAVVVAPPVVVDHPTTSSSTGVLVGAVSLTVLGVAAGGVFAGFGLSALSDQDALRTSCAPNCTAMQTSPIATKFTVANVALGSGIVALAAAGVLWIVWGTTHGTPARVVANGIAITF